MKKPVHLLIIDESPHEALLLVNALRMNGYEPEYKRVDTPEAMQTAIQKEHSWDAILSDCNMPCVLKSLGMMQQSAHDLPFIIVSDPLGEEVVITAMRAGAHGYVLKNNLQQLSVVLEREVREAAERKTRRRADSIKENEERWLQDVADAAIELENATLANEVKVSFESLVKTLSSTIDARDAITAGHSERVAAYALLIGEEMGLTSPQMNTLKYASLLHDIGKIGICEATLTKKGRLTETEYRHVQEHVAYTHEILKHVHFEFHLQEIPEIAAAHHERMDGTGYHRGLRGEEIPLLSRILALADVFDAITSHRHYRDRMPFNEAIGIIEEGSGTHFDADCVAAFMHARLTSLGRVLLMQHGKQYDESGQRLLRKLDKNIAIAEYRNILANEGRSNGEAETHRIFNSIYHHREVGDRA